MDASLRVPIQRLRPNVVLPAYQSEHAAGMDLHAAPVDDQPISIDPGAIRVVPCGFSIAVPVGYEGQIRPRSGLASRFGVTVPNAPGTIDADYRGEVMVALINLGKEPFTVTPGLRIAQLLIKPVPRVTWDERETLPDTARGEGGFGHTGA